MPGYFQKINGRSAEATGSEPFQGTLLQPESQPAIRNDEDYPGDSNELRPFESIIPGPVTQTNTPVVASTHSEPAVTPQQNTAPPTIEHKTIINPVTERITEFTSDNPKKRMVLPVEDQKVVTSIIEKIHERNFSHYAAVEHFTESSGFQSHTIKMTELVERPVVSNKNELNRVIVAEKQKILPSNEKEPAHSVIRENTKEILVPAESAAPTVQLVKNAATPKLVIGKITVEVIRQVQPAVKTREPQPIRQSNANPAPVNEFRGVDKLHFGLGQL